MKKKQLVAANIAARGVIYYEMENKNITMDLLFRFFRNEQTPRESDMIEQWLCEDESHLEIFRTAFTVFQAGETMPEEAPARGLSVRRFFAAAAALAAVFVLGVWLGTRFDPGRPAGPAGGDIPRVFVHQTPAGSRSSVILPDGSKVHLNSGSRLEYPETYSRQQRRIRLSGEAYFEVESDAERPFVVETAQCEITATGTRFDVIADARENEVRTALIEGVVSVSTAGGESVVTLRPGQEAVAQCGALSVSDLDDPAAAISWSSGIIDVAGVPFDRLMKTFERCFGVRIVVDCHQVPDVHYELAKVRISNGIRYAFEVLQKRSDFKYRYDEENQTYHIY